MEKWIVISNFIAILLSLYPCIFISVFILISISIISSDFHRWFIMSFLISVIFISYIIAYSYLYNVSTHYFSPQPHLSSIVICYIFYIHPAFLLPFSYILSQIYSYYEFIMLFCVAMPAVKPFPWNQSSFCVRYACGAAFVYTQCIFHQ